MKILNDWKLVILLCATLGLAPFFPEPHLWGKIKWIAGGAEGMQLMDWGDALMHGLPFLLLLRLGIRSILGRKSHLQNENDKKQKGQHP